MILPTRKPNRLPFEKIYQSNNGFFITICTHNKECLFVGECLRLPANTQPKTTTKTFSQRNNQLQINQLGQIVEQSWLSLPNIINNIELGEYVIMPNHFHGIIIFTDTPTFKSSNKELNLSHIIAMFKSKSTNLIRKCRGMPSASREALSGRQSHSPTKPSPIWQKSFWDHVIRNEKDFRRIEEYVYNNPLTWELDELNPLIKTGRQSHSPTKQLNT